MTSPQNSSVCAMASDRISELPDDILHLILTNIPTIDVARLSRLSRRWRHVWRSVPYVNLVQSDNKDWQEEIHTPGLIIECLRRRLEDLQHSDADYTVKRLTFVDSHDFRTIGPLNELLRSPKLVDNVKELDIWTYYNYYQFPSEMLNSESLSTVKLSRLKLDGLNCSVSLPSLRSLSLCHVSMCDETLTRLLSGSPSLENLELRISSGLKSPKISSSSLRSIRCFSRNYNCKKIFIDAANLQSLVLEDEFRLVFDVDEEPQRVSFSSCLALRNLVLRSVEVDDDAELFRDINCRFTLLESLELKDCYTSIKITISSQSLKKLIVHTPLGLSLTETTVESPNLVSFYCSASSGDRITVNSPNDQLNGIIRVRLVDEDEFRELYKFASNLNWSTNNTLTLYVHAHSIPLAATLFMKDFNGHPIWPDTKHMEVYDLSVGSEFLEFETSVKRFSSELERNPSLGTPVLKAIQNILYDYYVTYHSLIER